MASPTLPTPQQTPWLLCRGWKLQALLLLCWALQPLLLTLEQPVELCCWSARHSSAHQASPLPHRALLLLPSLKGHSSECQSWMVVCGAGGEKRRKSFFCATLFWRYPPNSTVWWHSPCSLYLGMLLFSKYSFPSSKALRSVISQLLMLGLAIEFALASGTWVDVKQERAWNGLVQLDWPCGAFAIARRMRLLDGPLSRKNKRQGDRARQSRPVAEAGPP